MKIIADETIIYRSIDPQSVYCYTPGLCAGFPNPDGSTRLIGVVDLGGPGVESKVDGPCSPAGDYHNQLRVLLSDDGGKTWRETSARLPMRHEIVFRTSEALYLLGNDTRLVISRSADNGETWSDPVVLEEGKWHQSCGAVDFHGDELYLVYEKFDDRNVWPGVMPVLMAAKLDRDLTRRENWRMSKPFSDIELMRAAQPSGIPAVALKDKYLAPGILETSVVRITDPDHPLFDPLDRTVVLCMRAYTGFNAVGAILLGVDNPDGTLEIRRAKSAAGIEMFLLPWPGGNLKFHLQYDAPSKLFWMVASIIDGVRGERSRLGLYYSPNLFDWTLGGLVAEGSPKPSSRHYATLLIDGNDILVLSRSGDGNAKTQHDNNLTTFHRVRDFRRLAD